MKFALVNPNWDFTGSVYFGCREPHFPLELGYSKQILESLGHEAVIIDGWMDGLGPEEIGSRLDDLKPHWTVVVTAPGYLFWRCPPPELKCPIELINSIRSIRDRAGRIAIAGPHGSVTPQMVFRKLSPDAVIMGEPDEVIAGLADFDRAVPGICRTDNAGKLKVSLPYATKMSGLPPISWPDEMIGKALHHHHRFDKKAEGPGAEIEASRGCPFSCTFCAKEAYRNAFRKRPVKTVLVEMDRLISQGARYFYFIDEIFMPDEALLEAIGKRNVTFGIQTRIDLWNPPELELLGRAGCVSVEAGVESVTERGRAAIDKKCRLSTEELFSLLCVAKKHVHFVQATLLDSGADPREEIEKWRKRMLDAGIWANSPVPLFPYPGSKEYEKRWGRPDDDAWERAADWYLDENSELSDIQDKKPSRIRDLERR